MKETSQIPLLPDQDFLLNSIVVYCVFLHPVLALAPTRSFIFFLQSCFIIVSWGMLFLVHALSLQLTVQPTDISAVMAQASIVSHCHGCARWTDFVLPVSLLVPVVIQIQVGQLGSQYGYLHCILCVGLSSLTCMLASFYKTWGTSTMLYPIHDCPWFLVLIA